MAQFDSNIKTSEVGISPPDKTALFNSVLRLSITELRDFINSQLDINPYLTSNSLFRRDYKVARQVIWDVDDIEPENLFPEKTLTEILLEQIENEIEDSEGVRIAKEITKRLDKYGYFRTNTSFLARQIDTSPEYIEHVLSKLQGFEPVGVYARDLPDCLRIQLSAQNKLTQEIYIALSNIDLLVSGKLSELQALSGASDEEFSKILTDLRQLEHNPIKAFQHTPADIIVPDFFANKHNGHALEVEVNTYSMPDIKFNDGFIELGLEQAKDEDDKFVTHATMLVDVLIKREQVLNDIVSTIFKNKPEIESNKVMISRDLELTLCDKFDFNTLEMKKICTSKHIDIDGTNHSFYFVGY